MSANDPSARGETILSIDLGRTATKACVSPDPDQVVLIPSNVAHLTVEDVRMGSADDEFGDPLLDLWLEYQGSGYALGRMAWDFGAGLGLGQPKTQDALIKVLGCAGFFNVNGPVGVIVGLPYESPRGFNEQKAELTKELTASNPHVLIYRGRPMSLDISWLRIVPEGYGSLILCESNPTAGEGYFQQRSVAVMDIGHQTTDFLMVDRFNFARAVSNSVGFAMSQFYEQVAEKIDGANSQSLDLMEAVHREKGHRKFRPKGSNRQTDLDAILPSLMNSFSQDLYTRFVEWLPERATDVIVTGGGGEFFWGNLKPLIEGETGLLAHIATPTRKANALGQYIYGQLNRVTQDRG